MFLRLVAESGAGPDCVTRLSYSSLVKLTYGRRLERLHQYPACGGKAQKARPIFDTAFQPAGISVRLLDPPRLIRPRWMSVLGWSR